MCSLNGASSSDDEASGSSGSDMDVEAPVEPVTYTMEVCMTELCDNAATTFFHGAVGTTAAEVTDASGEQPSAPPHRRRRPRSLPRSCPLVGSLSWSAASSAARHHAEQYTHQFCTSHPLSGIREMFPDAVIDDFLFEPCGYSMNGLQEAGLMTIHVTPESHCSYASVEISGHATSAFDPAELIAKAVKSFNPGKLSVSVSGDAPASVKAWASAPAAPEGMKATGTYAQKLSGEGFVSYMTAVRA